MNMFLLNTTGTYKVMQFLLNCTSFRKTSLDMKLDTADNVPPIPSFNEVEADINKSVLAEGIHYLKNWKITDNFCCTISLKKDEDFILVS